MSEDMKPKSKRGFACMDPEAVSAISSKGGKAAHAKGTAHRWGVEEARAAGRLGGKATREKKKVVFDETQGAAHPDNAPQHPDKTAGFAILYGTK
jgi:uncharacterized protein